MNIYQIQETNSGRILFEGQFPSFNQCLETAVKQRINLTRADFTNKNLSNANMDDAIMPGANFTNANLSGTNLSESTLTNANFTNTALYNTCLCYSDLTACEFQYTSFGATDIAGATITKARFSGTSCFTLNFMQTSDMQECAYIHSNGQTSEMSNPPIVINGADTHPIIIMDDTIKSVQSIVKHNNIREIAQRATTKLAQTKYR